jgi:hypothetical protein
LYRSPVWFDAYVESDVCRRLPAIARDLLDEWRHEDVDEDEAALLRRDSELVEALTAFVCAPCCRRAPAWWRSGDGECSLLTEPARL